MSPEMVCNNDNYRHNLLSFYYYFILIHLILFLIFIIFKKFIYLFIWLCLSCGTPGSFVVVQGLSSCDAWA